MKCGRTLTAAAVLTVTAVGTALAWGFDGHTMISRVAVEGLPADMPDFFTDAAEQLVYLGPEPDRWRDDELTTMDEAWKYDHYIDLENVPGDALEAPDRYAFIGALYAAGIDEPEQAVGFLPYRIEEMYQRLVTGFARWRVEDDATERTWIEARVINDAGILGHYIGDAANPHHTTIHFNGWSSDVPNPEGYTTSRDFHWQFESQFTGAHVEYDDVWAATPEGAGVVVEIHDAVRRYIMETHEDVIPMYELEQSVGFDPEAAAPEAEAFVVRRLASAATMLRTLWYSAWVESAEVAAREDG